MCVYEIRLDSRPNRKLHHQPIGAGELGWGIYYIYYISTTIKPMPALKCSIAKHQKSRGVGAPRKLLAPKFSCGFLYPPVFSAPAVGDPVGISRRSWYTQN